MLNIESRTRFDHLSTDEIIYGFFNINERLNNILLINEFHLKSLVLPITNQDPILSKILSKYLNIEYSLENLIQTIS
jgi:hypothetical protein